MKQKLLLCTILSACFFTFPQAGIAQELGKTVVKPKARILVKPPVPAYDGTYMTRDYVDYEDPDRFDGGPIHLK